MNVQEQPETLPCYLAVINDWLEGDGDGCKRDLLLMAARSLLACVMGATLFTAWLVEVPSGDAGECITT
jgi:hypothetical protein